MRVSKSLDPQPTPNWEGANSQVLGHPVPCFMAIRWGNNGNSERLFLGAPKSLCMVTAAMKLKDAYSLEEKLKQT